jgi:hypothetical protein
VPDSVIEVKGANSLDAKAAGEATHRAGVRS